MDTKNITLVLSAIAVFFSIFAFVRCSHSSDPLTDAARYKLASSVYKDIKTTNQLGREYQPIVNQLSNIKVDEETKAEVHSAIRSVAINNAQIAPVLANICKADVKPTDVEPIFTALYAYANQKKPTPKEDFDALLGKVGTEGLGAYTKFVQAHYGASEGTAIKMLCAATYATLKK